MQPHIWWQLWRVLGTIKMINHVSKCYWTNANTSEKQISNTEWWFKQDNTTELDPKLRGLAFSSVVFTLTTNNHNFSFLSPVVCLRKYLDIIPWLNNRDKDAVGLKSQVKSDHLFILRHKHNNLLLQTWHAWCRAQLFLNVSWKAFNSLQQTATTTLSRHPASDLLNGKQAFVVPH